MFIVALAVLLLGAILTVLPGAGRADAAADINVTTTDDVVDAGDGEMSLREAFDKANADAGNDTIVLPAGTYQLSIAPVGGLNGFGDLDHTDAGATLTVRGAGASTTSIVGMTIGDRIVEGHNGSSLILEDLTLRGGEDVGGAAVQMRGGDFTTDGVVLTQNHATDNGGAVFLDSPGSFVGTDTVFSNNSAVNGGGGLYLTGGSITATNVDFTNNTAENAAGAGVRATGGPFEFTGGTWSGNSADQIGGVARLLGDPTVTVTGVTASGNEAVNADGGALSVDGGSLTISEATFTGNTAGDSGGAVFVNGGSVTIDQSTFAENTATNVSGGAIWLNVGTTLAVTESIFSGNDASNHGGAIRQASGSTTIGESLFEDNTTGTYGGAFSAKAPSTVNIVNTTMVFNTAGNSGGAIKADGATITFATITSNTAGTAGSNIRSASLTANSSVSAYGKTVEECKVDATVVTNGAVFGGDASCFGVADGDPKLGGLAGNGGPTKTRLPAYDSPLINAGKAVSGVSLDQRGISRPEGSAVDIGAVEVREPVAVNDKATTNEDVAVKVSVKANDSDPDGVLTNSSVATRKAPAHGSTTDNSDGTITYRPNSGYFGTDTFTYGYNTVSGLTDTATVTITINSVGSRFTDIGDSLFITEIEWMADVGITKGCNPPDNTRFCPTTNVTRGQMAAFLNRAFDLPSTTTDYFIDDNDSVFEGDINRLAASGITKGCNPPTNDRFCPDGKVTRGQMAAFLVRAYRYTAGLGADLFIDDDGTVFEADNDRLGTAGVTRGCNPPTNDRYCPNNFVTREQMAAFLYRAEH